MAEIARSTALDSLDEKLIRAYGEKDKIGGAKQIKHVINNIKSIREGPSSPFSQQPVFRALLVPFGGSVGLVLLDYIAYL